MKVLNVISVVCLIVSASSWAVGQTRGTPKEGQAVYKQYCLRCHGEKLDGNGPEAQYLILRPANFQSQSLLAKTDWELLVTISNGVLFTPMHGFRGRLTDQQMLDVLSYIRSMAPFNAVG
ncbi:MAG: c-type cytochrome [Nitrospirae bacterium]|nr:c-type cytochrome [Nitrospirota bacterium]MDE3219047.1 cytochrome c [Nitrospirota bacterium]